MGGGGVHRLVGVQEFPLLQRQDIKGPPPPSLPNVSSRSLGFSLMASPKSVCHLQDMVGHVT